MVDICIYRTLLCGFALACCLQFPQSATAQAEQAVDKSADNLMVVLRESPGANKQDEALTPLGVFKFKTMLPFEMAAFELLGDMQIRFVFDGEHEMPVARPQDLARLNLSPEEALARAVANIKRVYGNPTAIPWTAVPWTAGMMLVEGKAPDFDSSYFLDRDFWRNLNKQFPEGLVAAVAKRGGLVFTPASNATAVERLRNGIAHLHASSKQMRISSALYLFKDDRWTVFQPPQPQAP